MICIHNFPDLYFSFFAIVKGDYKPKEMAMRFDKVALPENSIISAPIADNHTVCPRSSDPFYIVAYCIKWDTTSWTYSK